jgi:hypothetical protein
VRDRRVHAPLPDIVVARRLRYDDVLHRIAGKMRFQHQTAKERAMHRLLVAPMVAVGA